ncbi:MAG: NADPH-adrenodoxin reductase [Piccolia ochrophora]|nr:MAG: NADPH-adrenodoxin reductase [Piccolia ochrophora]
MSKLKNCVVDMYERLPVPFGLVRFGVAPDHPEVKNCQDKFASVAASPNFNFVGNISVGSDIPFTSLKPHYDAILLAYGASRDRELGIPGESSLNGIYSARAFVGWYDGLPEFAGLAPALDAGEDAIVIGQGNVALDIARILLTDIDALRKTDITDYALEALSKSRIKRVSVVGRRGPMQAAFTIKEVRELMNLPSVGFTPIDPSLFPRDPTTLPRPAKRLTQILARGSPSPPLTSPKSWSLRFLLSPSSFNASPSSPTHLSTTSFTPNTLSGTDPFSPTAHAVSTTSAPPIDLPSSIAFRSIGYKSVPIPGASALDIPFDPSLGIIPNDAHGRVLLPPSDPASPLARHLPGVYVAGWAKRGPTGVIASTMDDAFSTAEVIVQDWEGSALFLNHGAGEGTELGWEGVREEAERKGLRRVSWRDWERIDHVERERGREKGKERVKLGSVEEMLKVLDS